MKVCIIAAVCMASAGCSRQPQEVIVRSMPSPWPASEKWEYETITFYPAKPLTTDSGANRSDETCVDISEDDLNQQGKDGWELVTVIYEPYKSMDFVNHELASTDERAEAIAIFKRRIPEEK